MAFCNIRNYDNPTHTAHAFIPHQMDYVSLLPKVVNATLVTVTEVAVSTTSLVTVAEEATVGNDLIEVVAVVASALAPPPALVQALALASFILTCSSAAQCPLGKN